MNLIEIQKLNKEYPHDDKIHSIIDNFSFQCKKNEFYCIVGKSGCGKSTLLKIIGGFDAKYSGLIKSNGQPITTPSMERIMLFQDDSQLFSWKTVIENMLLPLKNKYSNFSKEALIEKATKYLELVDLVNYKDYYPHQLSGGMKQRVAIARALSLEPLVLLMDEPFGSLDAFTREGLQNLLIKIWAETHTTIIFVTHSIEEAITLSTHILIMGFPPNSIIETIKNPLPHPTNEFDSEFIELHHYIKDKIK